MRFVRNHLKVNKKLDYMKLKLFSQIQWKTLKEKFIKLNKLKRMFFVNYKATLVRIYRKKNKERFFYEVLDILSERKLDLLKLLIKSRILEFNSETQEGQKLLMLVAKYGNLEVLKLLEEFGVDFFYTKHLDSSVLHNACLYHEVDIVKYLIDKGYDCTAKTIQGITPLYVALKAYNFDIAEMLIDKIERDNLIDHTAHYIAQEGDILKMRFLLSLLPEAANFMDEFSCLPIHYAYLENNQKMLELLSEYTTVDYSFENISHFAILNRIFTHAIENNHNQLFKLLMNYNFMINARDPEGNTLLHVASLSNSVETVIMLLTFFSEIDINALNNNKKSALDLAIEADNQEVVNILLANGALLREPHATIIRKFLS